MDDSFADMLYRLPHIQHNSTSHVFTKLCWYFAFHVTVVYFVHMEAQFDRLYRKRFKAELKHLCSAALTDTCPGFAVRCLHDWM